MNVKVINAFADSAVKVLKMMAFVEATSSSPYIKKDNLARGDVSGIIVFTGSMEGSLALSFSEACILKVVSNMLGEEVKTVNNVIKDATGEITNMISGDARKTLQSEGLHISANIPSVVSGKDHLVSHTLQGPSIIIPFNTAYGSFVVDICIKGVA
jgi:chemotaxis protein CheX